MTGASKTGLGLGLGVLLIHTAAFAQRGHGVTTPVPIGAQILATQAPAPPPEPQPPAPEPQPQQPPQPYPQPPQPQPQQPPPYPQPPPPPYPAPQPPTTPQPPTSPNPYPYGPPPGYRLEPPPPYYYPPPPTARGIYRSFTISLGLGSGWLSLPRPREHRGGLNYLARVGFGITRNWIVFLGLDGATIGSPELSQTNYLLGAQFFFARRFYGRGGVGLATVSEETGYDSYGSAGQAFVAGLGVELIQGESVALGVEWASGLARFPTGSYFQNGLCLALVFY